MFPSYRNGFYIMGTLVVKGLTFLRVTRISKMAIFY